MRLLPTGDPTLACEIAQAIGYEMLASVYLCGSLETSDAVITAIVRFLKPPKIRRTVMSGLIREKCVFAIVRFLSLPFKVTAKETDGYILQTADTPELRILFMNYRREHFASDDPFAL